MICSEQDKYITNYMENNPCWIVTLNSGLVVFQDDNRPGVMPQSAWYRLYNYCQSTGDYITGMRIKFRSNLHHLPSNADGYYFSKGVRGGLTLTKTMQLFFIGILNNNVLNVTCWKVPEMLEEFTEERDARKAGVCLISKNILPI